MFDTPPNPSVSGSGITADLLGLLDGLPNAVLVLGHDWRILYANAEARRVSRIPDGDLSEESHWDLYPEILGTEAERVYRAAMESRQPTHFETYYAPFDVWLDIHLRPLGTGLGLYYRDVTEAKRNEAAREAIARQLEQVFEASPESIICIDRQWNCTYANGVATRLLGTDPVGKNTWRDLPGNLKEPFYSNYWATMQHRMPTEFEAYYGEPLNIWFRVYARPFEDGIIIFSSDITRGKQIELEREENSRTLERVFEATADGIVALDRNWIYTFLNRRAEEILLRSKESLLGKNLFDEFPAAHGSEFHRHYLQAMDNKVTSEFEAYYPAPLDVWLSVSCRPAEDGIVVFIRDITSRRRAEEALGEQEALLTSVQQASRVATWQLDPETNDVTYGPGSFPVFGRPFEEVSTGKAFAAALHPEHRERVLKALSEAVRTHGQFAMEIPVVSAEGATLWLEARGQYVDRDQPNATIRGMLIDITERKLNEQVLIESEARYRALAELNPQAIWMGDPQGRVTYANQGFQDYIGMAIDPSGDSPWIEVFPPEQRQRVIDIWTRSVTMGVDYEIEVPIRRAADQSDRWWNLRAVPVRDAAGEILYWLGVGADIHDSFTAAERLRIQHEEAERQRAEIEAVYETAPIGLALFDPKEFRYLRLNERQAQIVGLPKEQILGRTLTEIAPIEGLNEMFEQVAAGNPLRNQLLEGELPMSPGEHRFWNVNYLPVYAPDGSVQAITAASLEITHQKKAEAALVQSEKLAAVGRLASSISHEINNPLEAVTNLLYLLGVSDNLPDDLKIYVHMAQSEISRVSQIATQTLRFHRQAVRPSRVSAGELIDAVLNLYQGRLSNSNIRVESRYKTGTRILCFENDIRQVLNNLIANAIDAMRKGGRLVVRAHDATDYVTGRKGVRLSIADTGHGMSQAVARRIFEPFYTTKDLNGTGLGLWISEGIVQRHKGRITLRSCEDPAHHGSVFTLFLPLEATE